MGDHPLDADRTAELYRLLVGSAFDPMFALGKRCEFLFINEIGAANLGLTPDEVTGRLVREFFPPDLADELHARAEGVFESGEPSINNNHLVPMPDGPTWINTILYPAKGPDGKVESVLGISRDITPIKLAEEALRISSESLSAIVDRTADGILIVDNDALVRYANPAAKAFLERPRTPLEGRAFELPIELDTTTTVEIRHGEADLGTGEMAITSTEWEGEPAYLATIRDITERHRTELASVRTEELLREALESTSDGILITDMAGHVTHANARFGQIWGIPEQLLEEGDVERMLNFVMHLLEDPDGFRVMVEKSMISSVAGIGVVHLKDGRLIEQRSRPIMSGLRAMGRLVRFRDVTPTGG